MLQHWAHSRHRPTATDEKKKSLRYFGCDFSGWYNFGIIIKTVATRCHIYKLKCTKFDFGWHPAGGADRSPPNPLAGFKGPTCKRKERRGRKGHMGRGGILPYSQWLRYTVVTSSRLPICMSVKYSARIHEILDERMHEIRVG